MDTTTVTTTVNEILAAAGVGVWRPAGPAYTSAETAIVYGPLPATPNRAIGVTCYAATDDVETGRADRYVQVRCRGNPGAPNGADVIADAVFDTIHALYRSHGFARVTRTIRGISVADGNGRQERPDSYHVIIDNPEA